MTERKERTKNSDFENLLKKHNSLVQRLSDSDFPSVIEIASFAIGVYTCTSQNIDERAFLRSSLLFWARKEECGNLNLASEIQPYLYSGNQPLSREERESHVYPTLFSAILLEQARLKREYMSGKNPVDDVRKLVGFLQIVKGRDELYAEYVTKCEVFWTAIQKGEDPESRPPSIADGLRLEEFRLLRLKLHTTWSPAYGVDKSNLKVVRESLSVNELQD